MCHTHLGFGLVQLPADYFANLALDSASAVLPTTPGRAVTARRGPELPRFAIPRRQSDLHRAQTPRNRCYPPTPRRGRRRATIVEEIRAGNAGSPDWAALP